MGEKTEEAEKNDEKWKASGKKEKPEQRLEIGSPQEWWEGTEGNPEDSQGKVAAAQRAEQTWRPCPDTPDLQGLKPSIQ